MMETETGTETERWRMIETVGEVLEVEFVGMEEEIERVAGEETGVAGST